MCRADQHTIHAPLLIRGCRNELKYELGQLTEILECFESGGAEFKEVGAEISATFFVVSTRNTSPDGTKKEKQLVSVT